MPFSFRCHKYCQARLNLILDSLMTNSEQALLSESEHFRGSISQRLRESRRVHRRGTRMFDSGPDTHDRLLDVSQYKSLYSPELLFAIRLNRILMHSLEVAETLIEGLREYNMAQGTCAYKLMRMQYCSLCAGLDLTRPCPELCLTILSGCLKPLSELHLSWKRLTDALKTVTKTFLDKPQLNLIVQLRQLPGRLVTYYKHLLKTHTAWMEQLTVIWIRASSAICAESPHLIPSSKQPDRCWNGTTRGRFSFDRCDFCDTPNTSSNSLDFKMHALPIEELVTPGRRQRTSQFAVGADTAAFHRRKIPAEPFTYSAYLFTSQNRYTPEQQEKETATRRANEVLVQASRDLQWSSDSLLGELKAYKSIQRRFQEPISDKGSSQSTNERTESWIQIPSENSRPDITTHSNSDQEEVSNSLGLLAYGSMLGWNVPGVVARVSDHTRFEQADSTMRMSVHDQHRHRSSTKNSSTVHQRSNMSSQRSDGLAVAVSDPSEMSSGLQPSWPLIDWPNPATIPGLTAQVSSPTASSKQNPNAASGRDGTNRRPATQSQSSPSSDKAQDSSYEGSGFFRTPGSLPAFMEYADYPHLNTLHNLLQPNVGLPTRDETVAPRTDYENAPTDDEDFNESEPELSSNSDDTTRITSSNVKSRDWQHGSSERFNKSDILTTDNRVIKNKISDLTKNNEKTSTSGRSQINVSIPVILLVWIMMFFDT
ncbi:hypothetical protein EG68_07203 [Paragonimus skrjabini miyazakii]|uniref:Glypican n=1 Tax=Paragonimus skrjabini miyazakii TaxID=59628 RepID=A0A8S9Y813_9TREM|nr:hypothetical protein EG68_07203 [Paragonimus skrjabini miyazakii]